MILEGLKKDLDVEVTFDYFYSEGSYSTQEYEQITVLCVTHNGRECSYDLLARHQSMVRGYTVTSREIMEEIEEAAWEVVTDQEKDYDFLYELEKEEL